MRWPVRSSSWVGSRWRVRRGAAGILGMSVRLVRPAIRASQAVPVLRVLLVRQVLRGRPVPRVRHRRFLVRPGLRVRRGRPVNAAPTPPCRARPGRRECRGRPDRLARLDPRAPPELLARPVRTAQLVSRRPVGRSARAGPRTRAVARPASTQPTRSTPALHRHRIPEPRPPRRRHRPGCVATHSSVLVQPDLLGHGSALSSEATTKWPWPVLR